MLSPEKNARTLGRRLEVPRALRAFVRAQESKSSLSRCRSEGIRGLGSGCQSFAVSELHAGFFGLVVAARASR